MHKKSARLKVENVRYLNFHFLKFFVFVILVLFQTVAGAQQIANSKEQIMAFTSQWKGERFPDGRPKVSDSLIKRLANIGIEEAWQVMRNEGYNNQFESGCYSTIHAG